MNAVAILGTRGIPAAHGGFETFAEILALYLSRKGWNVTVYCQETSGGPAWTDFWQDIRLVHIPVTQQGSIGTIVFDWKATRHAAREMGAKLVLGYNTAVFNWLLRRAGHQVLTNMDGIEWQRAKWGMAAKSWFYLNERAAARLSSQLVADHPEIKRHLARHTRPERVTMIPYGATDVSNAGPEPVLSMGLQPGSYALVVARAEPENSVLDIVQAFVAAGTQFRLVVLGDYSPDANEYHRTVLEASSANVLFPGAIFDKKIVGALRRHCAVYLHGHQVGGTNPSLVEALGAGSAVIAHDNPFNRWVAGGGAEYFSEANQLARLLARLLGDEGALASLRKGAYRRFQEAFTWPAVLEAYEDLIVSCMGAGKDD